MIVDYPFDEPVKKMIKVQISDSAVREIDSMIKTTFWDPDGTPISAEKFMQALFGEIPKFFKSEEQLVKIWSDPNTREELLQELSDAGYAESQLEELRKLVHEACGDYDAQQQKQQGLALFLNQVRILPSPLCFTGWSPCLAGHRTRLVAHLRAPDGPSLDQHDRTRKLGARCRALRRGTVGRRHPAKACPGG